MSYVNFDKYPSWLLWRVLNNNRGRMADRTCNILGHYIHYKTMFFLFNSVLYFPHNWSRKKKGNNNDCDLNKIRHVLTS